MTGRMIGVDVGGTFTDFVALVEGQLRTAKVLSTPDDPSRAIVEGLDQLGLESAAVDLVHGTTVGTNAVLEGKGAKVVFVSSTGFGDMLGLGRQNRDLLYSLAQPRVEPPVEQSLCLEIEHGVQNAHPDKSSLVVERWSSHPITV